MSHRRSLSAIVIAAATIVAVAACGPTSQPSSQSSVAQSTSTKLSTPGASMAPSQSPTTAPQTPIATPMATLPPVTGDICGLLNNIQQAYDWAKRGGSVINGTCPQNKKLYSVFVGRNVSIDDAIAALKMKEGSRLSDFQNSAYTVTPFPLSSANLPGFPDTKGTQYEVITKESLTDPETHFTVHKFGFIAFSVTGVNGSFAGVMVTTNFNGGDGTMTDKMAPVMLEAGLIVPPTK